jgi:xanthine dehydrogenase accessory factor
MSDERIHPLQHALTWLEARKPVLLSAVATSRGSTPGTPGALMVVTDDATAGTVGGGGVEHHIIRHSRDGERGIVEWDHADTANDSLCSGHQTMVVVELTDGDRSALESALERLDRNGCGTLEIGPRGLVFDGGEARPASLVRESAAAWRADIPVGLTETLYLAGGGHVALAVSRVMATLPFRIVVLDNRPQLATLEVNRWAHDRRIVDWATVDREVVPGEHSWVVIMTHGHRHDAEVLERLLPLDLRFLGMLGSKAKVAAVRAKLLAGGADPDRLAAVHAPVGLPIASHTPPEIAVSIAAQLVGERNRRPSNA